MEQQSSLLIEGWRSTLIAYTKRHALVAAGLAIALTCVLILLGQGVASPKDQALDPGLGYALLGGAAGFAATALGALPALVLRSLPQRVEDVALGFAAGMMLAAAAFSLLLPGLDAATSQLGSKPLGASVVVGGMMLGVMLMLGLDTFTPHVHDNGGPCGPGYERYSGSWLFVFAMALHNLPEGMAIGVSFADADLSVGIPLTAAIAIQDIPEGLAVAVALRSAGVSAVNAVLIAAGSGLLEPAGALLGIGLSSGTAIAYPIGLGLAAGAMLFVVSHEVIPETHRNGHETSATVGLVAGFALMMVLDTSLG